MVRFHERGDLILGIVAMILAVFSVEDYRKVIITSNLIWILIILIFTVLVYMVLDNIVVYLISLYRGVVDDQTIHSDDKREYFASDIIFRDIYLFKVLYVLEYLTFSAVIICATLLLIWILSPRKYYIPEILSGVVMVVMTGISYKFVKRAETKFFVRIEPETYLDISEDTNFSITLINKYKDSPVIGTIRVLFPEETECKVLTKKNGVIKDERIPGQEFKKSFKLENTTKSSESFLPLKFSLRYTGSREGIDKIYVEIFAYRKYDNRIVPIEEYQPKIHVIPAYLHGSLSAQQIDDSSEIDRLSAIEYKLEEEV